MIAAPDPNRMFSVQKAELVVFHREVREVLTDFEMLIDIVKVRPNETIVYFSSVLPELNMNFPHRNWERESSEATRLSSLSMRW